MKCTEAVSVEAIFLEIKGWNIYTSPTIWIIYHLHKQEIEQSFELSMVIDPALSKPFSQCTYKANLTDCSTTGNYEQL